MFKIQQQIYEGLLPENERKYRQLLCSGKAVLVNDIWASNETPANIFNQQRKRLKRHEEILRIRREKRHEKEKSQRMPKNRPPSRRGRLRPEGMPLGAEPAYQVAALAADAIRTTAKITVSKIKEWQEERQRRLEAATRQPLRLTHERRKICRRATLSPCPSAIDIRVAWLFSRDSHARMLHLGALLDTLECHLDNGLKIVWCKATSGRWFPGIRGREGGIRGWIRVNCPELEQKYKTLMRYKSLAKKLRQALEILDPIPLTTLLEQNTNVSELFQQELHLQPRTTSAPHEERHERFAWEFGKKKEDIDGRIFLTNVNYRTTPMFNLSIDQFRTALDHARNAMTSILKRVTPVGHPYFNHLAGIIKQKVSEREHWWDNQLQTLF